MSFTMQTPQRALPGSFLSTPAPSNLRGTSENQSFQPVSYPVLPTNPPQRPDDAVVQSESSGAAPSKDQPKPLERAARTINDVLRQESGYPELDSYIGQGISADYDVSISSPWAPFQKTRVYNIPDKIFEQYNRAQVSTMMGLFAEFNHAWVTIDNAIYLWDYTQSDPQLVGFEEQPNSITAVKLVVPRPGVFLPNVSHLLIVVTTSEMLLIGLGCQTSPAGNKVVALYHTRMSLSIRGMDVRVIEGSAYTGRVFFANKTDNDVYELTYQQEEKWFYSRCGKVNHTTKGIAALTPALTFGQRSHEHIIQMVIDDTRKLLYTLSSESTIRTYFLKPNGGLDCTIIQTGSVTFSSIYHMVTTPTDLFGPGASIVTISPISSTEAQRMHLMATTSTGCRLFMSATPPSPSSVSIGAMGAPTSMRVQHVRFPPPQQGSQANQPSSTTPSSVDTQSKALSRIRRAQRFPVGYFFCFVTLEGQAATDMLFVCAPDSGRIAKPQESSLKFPESAIWIGLESHAEDIGLVSAPSVAASSPSGFGNELAIQFDKPAAEFAILTNTGVHTIRRRRLVDIFAAAIPYAGSEEGLKSEVRKFIRLYGRGETAATALAVACGQGQVLAADSRMTKITDPDVLDPARRVFIEFGGKPILNEESVADKSGPAIDNVRPSARHEAIALYISRLIRSAWKNWIIREERTPQGGFSIRPTVSLQKLRSIQRDLTKLQEFLASNKSFIDGLSGPESLSRVSNKKEEIALQAEHRALNSLIVLISNIIEGISFVLVMFDERVDEIVLSLSDNTRLRIRNLTFEGLFTSDNGKDLAKELVKAIVNRSIANGSNVDTVADALRRRCGSFCSSEDVVIFKAQEQLKKASGAGADSDAARRTLNESLRLFEEVADSLSMEHLESAISQYNSMEFYAGAIKLALTVAQQSDRGKKALGWINSDKDPQDPRKEAYETRARIYKLVHNVIEHVDQVSRQAPEMINGVYTTTARRRNEAYSIIEKSDDEVFQYDLYDWYLEKGWTDRLLALRSSYVVSYLERRAKQSVDHADLLWRYFAQMQRYHDAAAVQLQLAKSNFKLPLERRIEYLSKAKANASTSTPGTARQARQILLHEISEMLDVANIQDDLLQKLKYDERLLPEGRKEHMAHLDDQILNLTELFNAYADKGGYWDICLLIFQVADYRNPTDIKATWENLISKVHEDAVKRGQQQPYEAVAEKIRSMGNRLNLSESTFPIPILLPLLEIYAFTVQHQVGPPEWVLDTFLDLQVAPETLLNELQSMFRNDEAPFQGPNRRYIVSEILYLCKRWYLDSVRSSGQLFGDRKTAMEVSELLMTMMQNGLDPSKMEECRELRSRIEQYLM